jgi:ubiquinone/menaquinone biosynthesis C-methylase UbiE
MSKYVELIKANSESAKRYYLSSLEKKTEQQKALENLLIMKGIQPERVADIACGGGGASYHLAKLFPQASYTLVDMNDDAISLARDACKHLSASFHIGDIYDLKFEDESFDLVICWQTLSWLDKPKEALHELLRICKSGGMLYASSLFNTRHDVDVYSKVVDHTRQGSSEEAAFAYNTYSVLSLKNWVDRELKVHSFDIGIDLIYDGKGLGTYTGQLLDGRRLQLSAGMLLNWGIVEITK